MQTIDRKKLKATAHSLNPVVMVGQAGLTEAVLLEIGVALDCHELIKVRIRAERDERKAMNEKICVATGAELIQAIGQIAVLYRKSPDKTPPKATAPPKRPKKPKKPIKPTWPKTKSRW
jgi:RNA-binding protein